MNRRLPAIDWMRGLVMVLMTVDHASDAFNRGRVITDSAFLPQVPLPPVQFAVRWITHLCAPTFVFLAGTSLALSVGRRRDDGESIDAFIVKRGLLIAALDPLWLSWMFMEAPPTERILLQVLYAIGGSFVAMAALRRLPAGAIGAIGLAIAAGHELLARAWSGPVATLLVRGGELSIRDGHPVLLCAYPILPWLGIMMLGWAFGAYLLTGRDPRRLLVAAGVAALATFAVVRGVDAYGNDGLLRRDGSWVEWLHVSKYPPSLAYDGLELGIMALLLAGFFSIPKDRDPAALRPLLLFGRTAFFYYLLHAHLLSAASWLLGMHQRAGLPATFVATVVVAGALYPLCQWYLAAKRRHPRSVLRYV